MKKRTSSMSRRIVSLLMSMVLTLTLVTPAAFATEVVGGSGTTIVEGDMNPADPAPGEDSENNEDKNTEDGKDEQPTEPDDEDKNPDEDNGDDASKPDGDSKDKENPDGDKKDEENKNEQPTEDENNGDDEIALLNAENAADAWDGTAVDTSWYAGHENETKFSIGTAAELAGLAALVNGTAKDAEGNPIAAVNFKGKTIKLTADIDLNNQIWTPIGNGNNSFAFSGTFDGNGNTISGLNVPDANAPGLFGCIFGTVQNLIVKGSVTTGEDADNGDYWEAGGVVCDNNGTVQNCGFYGSVNDEIGLDAGGVAGGGYGEVLNCWYYMTDESSSVSKVSVCTATNCVVISSSGAMTADKLATLQTDAPNTGKVWSWKEGDAYPTLVSNVSRSMTLKPYLNSCTAKVAVSGLTGESGVYLLENGVNTVTLLLDSGYSGENVYVRTNAANADGQIQLTTSGVSVPIGNAEKTILYYGTEEDFEAGKWYTAGDAPYQISTGRELVYLAQLVNDGNNFSGKTIVLTADIDLNNQAWTPIGNENGFDAELAFSGTFNGDGYTVSGLNIPDTYFPGLFGQISTSAVVQNLIVKGSVTGGDEASGTWAEAAGVAAYNDGCIQNCGFYGTVTGSSDGSVTAYGVTGSFGGGTVKNCWYFKEAGSGADDVCGGTATNCVIISSAEPMTADKLETLKTAAPDTGKVWSWKAGDAYPTLIDPPKTITMQPVFPDCTAVVSAGETTLNVENDYTYEVTSDTVTITVSGNSGMLYYAASESEKDYKPGGNLTMLESSTTFNKNDLPKTYYYGTEEDFQLLAAWNSALGRSGNTATVTTADRLKALARMVNSGKDSMTGKTITLGTNIVWDGSDWTPIGTEKNPFKGTFTGYSRSGGYAAISGLSGDLFGVVDNNKTKIQYVTISGGTGRLVNTLKSGTVENCMSTAEVTGADGGLVGQNSGTVDSCYYYNAGSKNTPAVGGGNSVTVTKCFYLADTSTFGAKSDIGARTAEEFKLGRVAYELGGSSYVWVYDTTKAEKMPQLGNASTSLTMAVASELKLTKPGNQPKGVVVTLGSSDKKVLTDVAGNQYYYAASGYPKGVSDVPVTFTAPTGYQIVFAPAATQVGGKDYLRITGSNVEYTYSLVKADIRWYESAGAEKNYVLKSADELMGFCLLANGSIDGVSKNFNGWTLSLGNNIDLENSEWKPIPRFAGAFDGKGYEITGLNVNYTGGDFNSKTAGMFEKLVSPGQILNLAVSGSVQADGKINYVGGIVGTTESGSEIRFCRSNIAVKVDAANSTTNGMAYGGVTGKVQGAISNCLNEGTITVDYIKNKCYIGGVAGQVGSAADLCWNTGSVTASSTANKSIYTGGIVGYGAATNCYNNGSVTGATDKNKYVTGGISGNGNVTNSYNLGAVSGQGAAGITGRGTVNNSYYVCKRNGTEKMAYVNTNETLVTLGGDDGKTYMVGEKKLVDLLNDNHGTNELWFTNPEKNVYLPHHATKWDGETDTDCTFKTIAVTYDPNGGVNKDGSNTPVTVSEMVYVVGEDVITPAKHIMLAADAENLGFKHENGTFNSWKDSNGTKHTAGGIITGITTGITLYAQWDKIWMGEGSADDPYQISDAEKLTALQTQVNDQGFTYDGKWFKLTDSISLTGNWTPIGTPMAFAGSLDGNGKTIDGLNVNVISGNAGLFDSASGGTFKDLKLNGTVNGTFYTGGLIGGGSGVTLDNIEANVTVSGGSYTGGLVGRLLGTLPATAERTPDISNCTVHGSVIGRRYVGGIATSSADNSPKIENCHNYASITSTGTGGNNASAAGIWACNTYNAGGKFTSCTNNGAVTAQKYAAGIATAGTSVIGCVNSNAVVSNNGLAGGISNHAFTVERCGNVGSITGCKSPSEETGVAGIDNYGQNVLYCYNTGVVTCDNEMWAYGISANGRSKIRNSFSYVAGKDLGLTPNLPNVEVTNSYYLASSATAVSSAGEYATLTDFASGKVAWGVGGKGEGSQGGTGQDAKLGWWKQDKNDAYPTLLDNPDMSKRYYRTDVDCGTGGEVELARNASSTVKELSSKEAVYGPAGTSVTIKATPKDNTFGLKSLTWTHNGQTDVLPAKGTTNIVMPAESNGTIHAEFASVGPGGNGGYYYGGSGDGTGTGDKDDEGLQDGLNMDVEYDIKGLVLDAYAEWGSNGGNKSFQKWLEENPNVVRALLTNSLDNMATAAVGKKTDEAKDLAALLLASLNEHTGVDGKNGDTIAKALQKYIDSGSEEVFSAWLTGGGGMASGTYESIYGQYASSLAALADRLYSKWEASGTSMTFPVWLDSQQVTMESLSENAEEPDAEPDDTQTTEAPEDVPDGQDTEGGASGNSVWEVIGTVVRENPILVWSIVAVIAALIIVGAVRRYHKVKRDEHDEK